MTDKETKIGGSEVLSSALRTVLDKLSGVSRTSGPGGRNAIIQSSYGSPRITKDGFTIIKSISFQDKLESLAFQLVKDSCENTNKIAGDATTYNVNTFRAAYPSLYSLNANIADLEAGYNASTKLIEKLLTDLSKKVDFNGEDVKKIATISANGDETVGSMIAEAMRKVGAEGVITVEESKSSESSLEHKTGMNLDRGYISPYFSTNSEKMICELDDPFVLVTSKKISSIHQILPILEAIANCGRPLFIVAEDVEGEALSTLIINRIKGVIKVCAIKAPGFGDKRTAMLEDIAILTGSQLISEEAGDCTGDSGVDKMEKIGSAKRIVITKDSATIIEGIGEKDAIKSRIEFIRNQMAESTSDYEKEKLQERLAKLSGGVAVMKVGGTTELEVKELKDRIEDALNATRAAVSDGVVPGGGVAQLAIAHVAREIIKKDTTLSGSAQLVAEKILDAFAVNIRHIVGNTGRSADVVINTLTEQFIKDKLSSENIHTNVTKVYDALNHRYIGAYDHVIDPAKVIRVAFMNAINTIYMLLRTEAVVYFANEEKSVGASAAGMPGMGGMDY